ncbi:hypothetical protein JW979_06490, partial [bacterium]|nr:hypothetical protein [candidate division CSSED10-310 bacterium]
RCKVSGNIAYIAYGWGGLLMVDISNPASPEILGSWPGDTSKSISTVKLDGSILFALTPSSGIDILNVSDPLQPQLIGNISVPDTQITDFEMDSEYIYCSGSNKGIFVFQRSSNSEYPLVARADTPGDAVGITADTQRIYVADDYDLAVFRREHFGPDTSPPVSVITFPEEGSIQYGKSIPVKGSATDSGSGVRFVEVSIDDGMSWNQALGQDAWSYLLKGLEPGYIRLQTRAVDWFGNSGQESPPVTFSWRPDRPVISLAGFLNAHVSESGEKLFTIAALIIDAYDPGYIRNVELYYNGEPTGMFLERNGVSDNFIYYTLELTYETYNDDMLAYSLVATDVYNNSSIMWPLLSVRSN